MFFIWNNFSHREMTHDDAPLRFETKAEANEWINRNAGPYNQNAYSAYQYPGAAWCDRERERLASGVYLPTAWDTEGWYKDRMCALALFPHVLADQPDMVQYTENPVKGIKDKRTATTPGRFLRKFFGDRFDDKEITHYADYHRGKYANIPKLMWAATPHEIETVYSMDANFASCMQHKAEDEWSETGHPTRVYGAGDLKVAYLLGEFDPEAESDNDPDDETAPVLVARALVWPEQKKVGRVYGDAALLRNALQRYGIDTKSNNSSYDTMEGARILYIPTTHGAREDEEATTSPEYPNVVVPYIDGSANNLMKVGDYLVIHDPSFDEDSEEEVSPGQYYAQNQDGYARSRCRCQKCSKWARMETGVAVGYLDDALEAENWCIQCMSAFTFQCQDDWSYYSSEHFHQMEVVTHTRYGEDVRQVCLEERGKFYFQSGHDNRYYHVDNEVKMGNGTSWTTTQALAHGFESTVDFKFYPRTDRVLVGGSWMTLAQAEAIGANTLFGDTQLRMAA